MTPEHVARFWAKVDVSTPDDCWPFQGAAGNQRSGHRTFYFANRSALAHRVAWELANGPIPDGLCVCHHCDNPPCVNPAHLFLGTVADNNADRDRKGRGRLPAPEQVVRRGPGPINHGTVSAYVKRKCRCAACTAANSDYRRAKRLTKVKTP